MTLVKCKECGNPVSTEAKACPQCGARPQAKASYLWLILGLPAGAIALFLGVGFMNSSPEKSTARRAIDLCWDSVDAQNPLSGAHDLAAKTCQGMVRDFESKYGRAPSLRRY